MVATVLRTNSSLFVRSFTSKQICGDYEKLFIGTIDILYTLDSASNYSAIQKLKP